MRDVNYNQYFIIPATSTPLKKRRYNYLDQHSENDQRNHEMQEGGLESLSQSCSDMLRRPGRPRKHGDALGDMRARSLSAGRRYHCPVCPRYFNSKPDRQTHMLEHYGGRPFTCNMCDYKSARKGNRDRHVRSVHRNDLKSEM